MSGWFDRLIEEAQWMVCITVMCSVGAVAGVIVWMVWDTSDVLTIACAVWCMHAMMMLVIWLFNGHPRFIRRI